MGWRIIAFECLKIKQWFGLMIQHEAVLCMYTHIKKGVCVCMFLCICNRHRVVDIFPGRHPQMEKYNCLQHGPDHLVNFPPARTHPSYLCSSVSQCKTGTDTLCIHNWEPQWCEDWLKVMVRVCRGALREIRVGSSCAWHQLGVDGRNERLIRPVNGRNVQAR